MLNDDETLELVQLYVETALKHSKTNDAISKALKMLCVDNEFVSSGDYMIANYDTTIRKLIGDYLMDWVDWWMYDCEFGTKSSTYTIASDDNLSNRAISYDVSEQTFSEFFRTVSS